MYWAVLVFHTKSGMNHVSHLDLHACKHVGKCVNVRIDMCMVAMQSCMNHPSHPNLRVCA